MRNVGEESRKTYQEFIDTGFFKTFMSGKGLDIGYRGYLKDVVPILETATGIDTDYPGYDGKTLPFPEESQDYVYSSHTLEHISDYKQALRDWFRVLCEDGYMVLTVPHKFLYEKKASLPSRWNGDHKRFYTPASLLQEVEESLTPNSYRVIMCRDMDKDFNYSRPPETHSSGCYEILLVLQKIKTPTWEIK